MRIYEYKDYNEYVEAQTKTNRNKLSWVYWKPASLEGVSNHKKTADNILCHGTRNGAELKFFKKRFPNAYVVGTEISDTATQFHMTVQHDFTLPKEEWLGKFDIVYSNSFDHSIDPEKTIDTWKNQLSPTGTLYLEYSEEQSEGSYADPLDATAKEIEELISTQLDVVGKITKGIKRSGVIFICERKQDD